MLGRPISCSLQQTDRIRRSFARHHNNFPPVPRQSMMAGSADAAVAADGGGKARSAGTVDR
jgi:hypothetical protein